MSQYGSSRLTSDSPRLYRSGNPFKRPCPLVPITFNRAQLQAEQERMAVHGAKKVPKLVGSGPKGKPTRAEMKEHSKLTKGVEQEGKLAEKIAAMFPDVEKEEARVQRAHRKIQQERTNKLLMLARQQEPRSRTRRSTQKVDYTYGDWDSGEEDVSHGGRSGADMSRTNHDVGPGEDEEQLGTSQTPGAPLSQVKDDPHESMLARPPRRRSTKIRHLQARHHHHHRVRPRSRSPPSARFFLKE